LMKRLRGFGLISRLPIGEHVRQEPMQ
jgi:hypothetical protein